MVNHYRWDFIGLSTDDKPTPATSEKVTDGSTFYCADNSKLYVYCKDNWYEKTATGGGGYELPIASAETLGGVKVGSNLTIDAETGVLSATGGGGGGDFTELDSDDYNYPEATPDGVALWLIPTTGLYKIKANTKFYRKASGSGSSATLTNDTYVVITKLANNDTVVNFLSVGGNLAEYGSGWSLTTTGAENSDYDSNSATGNDAFIRHGAVVDNLTSNKARVPLSAKQGKVLDEKISALEARVAALEG